MKALKKKAQESTTKQLVGKKRTRDDKAPTTPSVDKKQVTLAEDKHDLGKCLYYLLQI